MLLLGEEKAIKHNNGCSYILLQIHFVVPRITLYFLEQDLMGRSLVVGSLFQNFLCIVPYNRLRHQLFHLKKKNTLKSILSVSNNLNTILEIIYYIIIYMILI